MRTSLLQQPVRKKESHSLKEKQRSVYGRLIQMLLKKIIQHPQLLLHQVILLLQ